MMECKVKRTREDAIIPKKAHLTDTGYDLWVLDKHKELDNGVVMYSTGLQIEPPSGFYFEIVPRSSIIKSGHIQANSVGKIGQLVLRQVLTCEFIEADELHDSQRGEGGFGSTDKMDLKVAS